VSHTFTLSGPSTLYASDDAESRLHVGLPVADERERILGPQFLTQAFRRGKPIEIRNFLAELCGVRVIENGNVFAELMKTVRVCSLGQITNALFEVGSIGGVCRCRKVVTVRESPEIAPRLAPNERGIMRGFQS
jgi:hypothetical protein